MSMTELAHGRAIRLWRVRFGTVGAHTSIVVVVMMFAIGNTRASVAQPMHVIGCHRRAKHCRRKEQGEHLQHGAQLVHGRLDIEYNKRAQAVVLALARLLIGRRAGPMSFLDRRLSGKGWRNRISLKLRPNGRMQDAATAPIDHLEFLDAPIRYAEVSRSIVGR